MPALSLQHGALPAAVGAAAVQHRHVRFSHNAVADPGPQIFYFNNLVFSFVHQDSVLLQNGVKTASQAHCPSKCGCDSSLIRLEDTEQHVDLHEVNNINNLFMIFKENSP